MADLDLSSPEAKKIVDEFLALTDQASKIEAFHDPARYPVLGRVFNAVHFPKPVEVTETKQP